MVSYGLEDQFNRTHELINDRSQSYRNAVYASHTDPNNADIVIVGQHKEDSSASIRIYDGDNKKADLTFKDELSDKGQSLCFTDVLKVISADNLLENLVVGTNRGSLIVKGLPPRFLRDEPNFRYGETMAHFGEVTAL